MKMMFKLSALMLLVSLLFNACKKDETKLYYNGGTAPKLTAVVSADTVSYINADKIVLSLNWTNPNYDFTTGVSSLDVTYNIEIDTAGSNFTNPNKKVISVSKDLSYSFTASALNDVMQNQLNLLPNIPHILQIRVISSLSNSSAQLISDSIQYTAIPYIIPPKVAAPTSGELYITGSATAGNWMSAGDAPLQSQKFTTINPTLFEISVPLIGSGSYTFVPIYGDWGTKYSIKTKNDPSEVNGGDFQVGGEDILAPSESATYKITVNFQTGKFSVTKQ